MTKPRASTAVDCPVCNKTIGRKADLSRHMRTHATNKEELMHVCPYLGCTYKTLQRSNLMTHLNVHSGERPHKCPADGCDFSSSDPGSLTRHRKEVHSYDPKPNSDNHPTAITRKAARRQRRISPYSTSSTTSGSSGHSVSPPSTTYHTASPQVPQLLEPSPPLSPLLAGNRTKGSKNTSAAYSTELITKLPKVNDSTPAPGPAQPVSGTPLGSEAAFDDFLAQFNDWNAAVASAYTPAPLVQHTIVAPIPASFPSYEYTVDNAPYGYSTDSTSFAAQFSQPYSFAAPDMGVYPQVTDPTSFYPSSAATSALPMHGFYLY